MCGVRVEGGGEREKGGGVRTIRGGKVIKLRLGGRNSSSTPLGNLVCPYSSLNQSAPVDVFEEGVGHNLTRARFW